MNWIHEAIRGFGSSEDKICLLLSYPLPPSKPTIRVFFAQILKCSLVSSDVSILVDVVNHCDYQLVFNLFESGDCSLCVHPVTDNGFINR